MSLKVYSYTKQHTLINHLINVIYNNNSPVDPFKKEKIIVQSAGMAKWLQLKIAQAKDVCFNIDFIFPNNFIEEIFELSSIIKNDLSANLNSDTMLFQILKYIPEFAENDNDFITIKNYLNSRQESGLKLYNLSAKIAYIFDQYIIYRPEWIKNWKLGKFNTDNIFDEKWQSKLFLKITENYKTKADYYYEFIEKTDLNNIKNLPDRICVFGISSLPEYYVKILEKLSQKCEVNIFFLNPTTEFWGDLIKEKQKNIKENKSMKAGIDPELLHFETGNELLAFLGKTGQDFFNLLNDTQYSEWIDEDYNNEIYKNNTLLDKIKNSIYFLEKDKNNIIDEENLSIQIHACHSKVRELEVLKNILLKIISENSDINPENIVVMAPDIEEYSPYIHGIFGSDRKSEFFLNYSVSDVTLNNQSQVISLFNFMLDFVSSRFKVNDFFKIISDEVILDNFGLSLNSVEYIKKWLYETKICWGIDKEHRNKNVEFQYDEFSFDRGFDSMMAGFAMTAEDSSYNGLYTYDEIEGQNGRLLGIITEIYSKLKQMNSYSEKKFSIIEWVEKTLNCFNFMFIKTENHEKEKNYVQVFLNNILNNEKIKEFNEEISYNVFKQFVSDRLGVEKIERGFLSGGITFSSMLPMRSVPFKVVCLIGMNNQSFPRNDNKLKFDLMGIKYKPGDRSLRESDKYLFLESILSAEKYLIITYEGINFKDNTRKVPSITVTMLIEYIKSNYCLKDNHEIEKKLVFHHKMQPFNSEYFLKSSAYYSYSDFDYQIAEKLAGKTSKKQEAKNIKKNLLLSSDKEDELQKDFFMDEIIRFFKSPSKYFVNNTLGMYISEYDTNLSDDECFNLEKKSYIIKKIVDEHIQNNSVLVNNFFNRDLYFMLPPGGFGKLEIKDLLLKTEKLMSKINKITHGVLPVTKEFEVINREFNVKIRIENFVPDVGQILYYPAERLYNNNLLEIWLRHVFLGLVGLKQQKQLKTYYINLNEIYVFEPLKNVSEIIENLVEIYRENKKGEFVFFPNSSVEFYKTYMEKLEKFDEEKAVEEGIKEAFKKWNGNYKLTGEKEFDYNKFIFKEQDIVKTSEFVENSLKVLKGLEIPENTYENF